MKHATRKEQARSGLGLCNVVDILRDHGGFLRLRTGRQSLYADLSLERDAAYGTLPDLREWPVADDGPAQAARLADDAAAADRARRMKQVFLHRFPRSVGVGEVDTIMAFVAPRGFEQGRVAAELEREIDVRLVPDKLIIVCRDSIADDVARDFMGSGSLLRLRERMLPDTPTTLLSFGDNSGIEIRRQVLSTLDKPSNVKLDDLLRRGATAIFRSNGGFVEATSAYHFRNPSGRHTSRFMRLSNILVRQPEIMLLGVCALKYVSTRTHKILRGTPSLFAVVAAMNDVRETEAGLPPISADSYRSYHGVRTYANFDLEHAVAMVSASSSGGLARILQERGFDPQAVVHLLFLGNRTPAITVSIDLHRDADNPGGFNFTTEGNGDGDCSLCATGSLPITLEGDQFDVAGPQPEPLVITRTPAHTALRALMDRHAGTRTFRVNGGLPVRQYAVDPDAVGSVGDALKRLNYLAAAKIPARLGHCVAANEGSRKFAQRLLVAGRFEGEGAAPGRVRGRGGQGGQALRRSSPRGARYQRRRPPAARHQPAPALVPRRADHLLRGHRDDAERGADQGARQQSRPDVEPCQPSARHPRRDQPAGDGRAEPMERRTVAA